MMLDVVEGGGGEGEGVKRGERRGGGFKLYMSFYK